MTKPVSVLNIADLAVRSKSGYPPPHNQAVKGRSSVALGNPFDLTHFGVNIIILEPGAWASQRHWHEDEDEFAYALEGEMILVDDFGRHEFKPGQCAGFKANIANGHHIINESDKTAKFLIVGTRGEKEVCHYPDVDMKYARVNGKACFTKKDGTS